MARILIPSGTYLGQRVLSINQNIMNTRDQVTRLKLILDQISVGGTVTSNLETSPETLFPVGQGGTIYSGVVSMKTALDGLAAFGSTIDIG